MASLRQPILVTGISGFIAGHLAERLLKDGFAVRGMSRNPEKVGRFAALGAEMVYGDLLDPASLARAVAGCQIVVHAAAWTVAADSISADLAWSTNVNGTTNLLAAARACNVGTFLHISSMAVYGVAERSLIDEGVLCVPVGHPYPDSKIGAEVAVRASGVPYVIIRPSHVYGPRDVWSNRILDQLRGNQVVINERDEGLLTPAYIDNVVDAILLALNKKNLVNETFNICDDEAISYRQFYCAYAKMLGTSVPSGLNLRSRFSRSRVGAVVRLLRGRPAPDRWSLHVRYHPLRYSFEHARLLLGYEPKVQFSEGMARTERWLRENGFIGEN